MKFHAVRGRAVVWVVAVAVLLGMGGVVAAQFITSPGERAAETDPPAPSVITVPVELRRLTDTVVVRGQVSAEQTVNVAPQPGGGKDGAGKPVVTGVRVKPGDVLRSGQVLIEVSGRPVFVLAGEVPVYRDLKPGSEGRDVRQLQAALAALGWKSAPDKEGSYGAGTRKAVESLYERLGYEEVESPDAGEEQLRAAEDRVTRADRAVKSAADALAAAKEGGGRTGAGQPPGGGDPVKSAQQQLAYAHEDSVRAGKDLDGLRAKAGAMVPAAEVVFLRGFPGRVDAVGAQVGGEVKDKAVTISAGALVVKGQLAPHEKGLVRPGMKVGLLSELAGTTAEGTVTSVVDKPSASGDEQGQGPGTGARARTFEMVVTPVSALDPELAGQDVRLTVEAASSEGDVLVVPLSAVSAGADGRTVVTVQAADGRQHRVEVRPGTTGDGYVQVTVVGDGQLGAGERVVVGVRHGGGEGGGGGGGGGSGTSAGAGTSPGTGTGGGPGTPDPGAPTGDAR
ncbi:peptidoglycan-binding protein [Streptomyces sp. NPDC054961]